MPRISRRYTPAVIAEIQHRRRSGESVEEIAAAIGTTPGALRSTCSLLRISLRTESSPNGGARLDSFKLARGELEPLRITPSVETRARLRIEAVKRGIGVEELARDVLTVVAEDQIFGAVLDR